MAESLIRLYEKEALNFLKTTTIKFSPFADLINTNLINNGYSVDTTNPATWKYYLNIIGSYHSSDTVMTVVSLDNRETIDFTPANLARHPKTRAAYQVGMAYHTTLCDRYPEQTDLIRSILYPADDIYEAIEAEDLTILSFGDGFLEAAEQDVIVYELERTLEAMSSQWYHHFLKYEEYFYITFYPIMLAVLAAVIYAARLKYQHTASAHSFHIWEYLKSNGLGDYRDLLTSSQSLFMYRNYPYIKANRGKHSNLVLLTEELLNPIGVNIVGKTIYQQTADGADECRWIPEILSESVQLTDSEKITSIPIDTIESMTYKLVNSGHDIRTDNEYIMDQEEYIGSTRLNMLSTKILEIRETGVDKKYSDLLNRFFTDTLIFMTNTDRYQATVEFTDSIWGKPVNLSAKEALVLFYYAMYRAHGQTPVNLPNKYMSTSCFRPDVDISAIPKEIAYDGYIYPIGHAIDFEGLAKNIAYPASPIYDADEFSEVTSALFETMISHVRYIRQIGDFIHNKAMERLYPTYYLIRETYQISLSNHTLYSDWFSDENTPYQNLITAYESLADPETSYEALASTIMLALVPVNTATMTKYMASTDHLTEVYKRMKTLFIQLCSYEINFIDTDRTKKLWFMSDKVCTHIRDMDGSMQLNIDIPEGVVSGKVEASSTLDIESAAIEMHRLSQVGSQAIDMPKFSTFDTSVTGSQQVRDEKELKTTVTATGGSSTIDIGGAFTVSFTIPSD